jgi:hypothetical protein
MADNVAISAGTGTSVATDQVGSDHFQKIKIADGTADSSAMIGGDATNGLDVDVTRIIPGTGATALGKAEDAAHASGDTGVAVWGVRQDTQASFGADGDYTPLRIDSTGNLAVALPSTQVASVLDVQTSITRPADTNAYTANDAFANSTSAPTAGGFTFSNAASASGGGGRIDAAVIVASAATIYAGEIWIYDSAVSAVPNDNAAFASADADQLLLIGKIPFTLVANVSTSSDAYITGLAMPYHCVGTANLRFTVRITNAPTPASAEVLTVRLLGVRS